MSNEFSSSEAVSQLVDEEHERRRRAIIWEVMDFNEVDEIHVLVSHHFDRSKAVFRCTGIEPSVSPKSKTAILDEPVCFPFSRKGCDFGSLKEVILYCIQHFIHRSYVGPNSENVTFFRKSRSVKVFSEQGFKNEKNV